MTNVLCACTDLAEILQAVLDLALLFLVSKRLYRLDALFWI